MAFYLFEALALLLGVALAWVGYWGGRNTVTAKFWSVRGWVASIPGCIAFGWFFRGWSALSRPMAYGFLAGLLLELCRRAYRLLKARREKA